MVHLDLVDLRAQLVLPGLQVLAGHPGLVVQLELVLPGRQGQVVPLVQVVHPGQRVQESLARQALQDPAVRQAHLVQLALV